ncbi:hypothetical protein JOY44_29585 (plasmid) [Phormidium sp. CLA17]|uniref:hypothetical protein n=1 Tax=Leptolyngbya sp. Cla-17 TaxID=2803751 RepID=UPI0014924662|nr:hypothetical protein [Leptolyngbya sp. Cla-17]MBM0745575.1 hypothetical protein [Leptolyngbya sp. Cla-17]
MKRPQIRPPKPVPPPCRGQLPLFDRLTTLIIETDADPDYERAKQIFAELLEENYGS